MTFYYCVINYLLSDKVISYFAYKLFNHFVIKIEIVKGYTKTKPL